MQIEHNGLIEFHCMRDGRDQPEMITKRYAKEWHDDDDNMTWTLTIRNDDTHPDKHDDAGRQE